MQAATVRVNGFDFDSLAPVQGNVRDEDIEKVKKDAAHWAIGWLLSIDITAAGFWLGKWWYFDGCRYAIILFHKMSGGFLTMVEQGLM
jgi:hypothetical protein